MVTMLPTPGQRARTHALLQRLFLAAIARLNPAERTTRALADANWKPARAVLVAAGKSALSMASGALIHLTSNGVALAGGVVAVPAHALGGAAFGLGMDGAGLDGLDGDGEARAGADAGAGALETAETAEAAEHGEHAGHAGDAGHEARDGDAGDTGDGNARPGAEPAPGEPADAWPLVCAGGHPTPDRGSMLAATRACQAVASAPPDAEVLVLISGGASALMALPAPGLSLIDKNTVVSAVAASGAGRRTVNMVRKHLSAIKGGRLAAMSPVSMTTLIASDVVGDDLTAVGSGPTLPDPTTVRQACDAAAAAMGWGAVPWRVRAHFEAALAGETPGTPKSGRPGDRVALLAGTDALVDAAVTLARETGFQARAFARDLLGDAGAVAQRIAVQARRLAAASPGSPMCFAGTGEPTVALPAHAGVGGRAQQVALMVAREIAGIGGVSVLVAASDGIDGNSEAAGAVVDGYTWDSVIAAGIDPVRALARCDAGTALAAVGASMFTGATEIHHGDLVLIATGV
jgi:glycerate-2-kinase